LKHERKLRKLWQETRDPACKTAVNWVTRNIRRMVQRKAVERLETKLTNCKVTLQAIWPIAKSSTKRGGPKASSAIHGPSGTYVKPNDKANITADCLQDQFRAHGLYDCNHRRHVEAKVEGLLLPSMKTPLLISDLECYILASY
jgi:hypothetical protein